MKKLVILFTLFAFISCSDGDFDVPAFDFTETLNTCGEYVLYRANTDKTEALILTISQESLDNENTNISSDISITYRVFNDSFGSDYFCQTIPPTSPKVIKELLGEKATIHIAKTEILTDTIVTGYTYEISFSDLLLKNEDDKVYFETFDFGSFDISSN